MFTKKVERKTDRRQSKRERMVNNVVDAIFNLTPLEAPQPVILRCGVIAEQAFGLSWKDDKAYREIRNVMDDVRNDLQQLNIFIVPVNRRIHQKTPFTISNPNWEETGPESEKETNFEWRWVSWKNRHVRDEDYRTDDPNGRPPDHPKRQMGYLRFPVSEMVTIQNSETDTPISWLVTESNQLEMLKQCLPCRSYPAEAIAVHLPGNESPLVDVATGRAVQRVKTSLDTVMNGMSATANAGLLPEARRDKMKAKITVS